MFPGRGFCDQQEGSPCLLLIILFTVPEAATDSASLPSLGTTAVPSSSTQRKISVGPASTGAGKSGQGGMGWGQHWTADLTPLPIPQ